MSSHEASHHPLSHVFASCKVCRTPVTWDNLLETCPGEDRDHEPMWGVGDAERLHRSVDDAVESVLDQDFSELVEGGIVLVQKFAPMRIPITDWRIDTLIDTSLDAFYDKTWDEEGAEPPAVADVPVEIRALFRLALGALERWYPTTSCEVVRPAEVVSVDAEEWITKNHPEWREKADT